MYNKIYMDGIVEEIGCTYNYDELDVGGGINKPGTLHDPYFSWETEGWKRVCYDRLVFGSRVYWSVNFKYARENYENFDVCE